MQRGDRVLLKDITMNISPVGTPEQIAAIAAAGNELSQYLSRAEGHLICDVAYEYAGVPIDGWNRSGYSNLIIIRNRFVNPESGLDERNYFGGSVAAENVLFDSIDFRAPLVNVSRQTQLVFRIITRDMDSTMQIRPDNSRP